MRNKIDGIFEILERKNPSEIIKLACKAGNTNLLDLVLKNCEDINYTEFCDAVYEMGYNDNANIIIYCIDRLGENAGHLIDLTIENPPVEDAHVIDLEDLLDEVKNSLFKEKVSEYLCKAKDESIESRSLIRKLLLDDEIADKKKLAKLFAKSIGRWSSKDIKMVLCEGKDFDKYEIVKNFIKYNEYQNIVDILEDDDIKDTCKDEFISALASLKKNKNGSISELILKCAMVFGNDNRLENAILATEDIDKITEYARRIEEVNLEKINEFMIYKCNDINKLYTYLTNVPKAYKIDRLVFMDKFIEAKEVSKALQLYKKLNCRTERLIDLIASCGTPNQFYELLESTKLFTFVELNKLAKAVIQAGDVKTIKNVTDKLIRAHSNTNLLAYINLFRNLITSIFKPENYAEIIQLKSIKISEDVWKDFDIKKLIMDYIKNFEVKEKDIQVICNFVSENLLMWLGIKDAVINSSNADFIYRFAKTMLGVENRFSKEDEFILLKEFTNAIANTKDAKYITRFANTFENVDKDILTDALLETNSVYYIYEALKISGMNKEKIEGYLFDTNDAGVVSLLESDYDFAYPERLLKYCINNNLDKYMYLFYTKYHILDMEKGIECAIKEDTIGELIKKLQVSHDVDASNIDYAKLEDLAIASGNIKIMYEVAQLEGTDKTKLAYNALVLYSKDRAQDMNWLRLLMKPKSYEIDIDSIIEKILKRPKEMMEEAYAEKIYNFTQLLDSCFVSFNHERMLQAILDTGVDEYIICFLQNIQDIDYIKHADIYRKYSEYLNWSNNSMRELFSRFIYADTFELQREYATKTDLFQDIYDSLKYDHYNAIDKHYVCAALNFPECGYDELVDIVKDQRRYEDDECYSDYLGKHIVPEEGWQMLYRKSGKLDEFINLLHEQNVQEGFIDALIDKYYLEDNQKLLTSSPKAKAKKDQH